MSLDHSQLNHNKSFQSQQATIPQNPSGGYLLAGTSSTNPLADSSSNPNFATNQSINIANAAHSLDASGHQATLHTHHHHHVHQFAPQPPSTNPPVQANLIGGTYLNSNIIVHHQKTKTQGSTAGFNSAA